MEIVDPIDPGLLEHAVAVADTIVLNDSGSEETVARVYALTTNSTLDALRRWRLQPARLSLCLLNVFPEHCHDKAITGTIGQAILDTSKGFSAEM